MKNTTPRQLAGLAAVTVSGIMLFLALIIKLIFPDSISWLIVFIAPPVIFISVLAVFYLPHGKLYLSKNQADL